MPPEDLTGVVGLMAVLGVAVWLAAGRSSPKLIGGLGLLVALLGAFYLYVVGASISTSNGLIALILFVGSAVLFRLLSTFEQ